MPPTALDALDLPAGRAASLAPQTRGLGRCTAHHGEILQGAFRDRDGATAPGLVTLPCVTAATVASFVPAAGKELHVLPADRSKARAAARLALDALGLAQTGGLLRIESDIPVGAGLGSSTADVVAAMRAVANAFGTELDPAHVARLAVSAETASDSTMFPTGVMLFAQRSGAVLERLAAQLPPMIAVGVDTAPGRPVDTLSLRPRQWTEHEVETYEFLRAQLRRALRTADARLLGHVATQSALLNRSVMETPRLHELIAIARDEGAVGVQIAHSGTVAALLFDAQEDAAPAHAARAGAVLAEAGFAAGLSFRL